MAKSTLGTKKNGVPPGLRFWALPGNAAMHPKFTKVGPFPRCYQAGSACTVSMSLGSSLWPATLTCLPPYPLEVLPVSFPSILGRNSVLAQAVEYHIYKQYRSLGQEDPLGKGMATHPIQYSRLENSTIITSSKPNYVQRLYLLIPTH